MAVRGGSRRAQAQTLGTFYGYADRYQCSASGTQDRARQAMSVDHVEDGVATARSSADAPEIESIVRTTGAGELRAGQVERVRITDVDDYDLDAALLT